MFLFTHTLANILKRMTLHKMTYLILVLFSITSCKRNHISDEKILSDIFPQLVDSLHIKWRPIPPPPPPPLYDKDSNFVGIDSTKMKLILSVHQKYLNRIDSIDSRTLIGIGDSCFLIDWNDLKSRIFIEDSLMLRVISFNETEMSISRELNLNQIKIPNGFKLISKSELEDNYSNIWSTLNDYKFAGLIVISKIYLSKNNDSGLLQIDYYNNESNGNSYFIILVKTNKKWRVKKLLMNWES